MTFLRRVVRVADRLRALPDLSHAHLEELLHEIRAGLAAKVAGPGQADEPDARLAVAVRPPSA